MIDHCVGRLTVWKGDLILSRLDHGNITGPNTNTQAQLEIGRPSGGLSCLRRLALAPPFLASARCLSAWHENENNSMASLLIRLCDIANSDDGRPTRQRISFCCEWRRK